MGSSDRIERGQISENHCGTDSCTWTGIGMTHDRRAGITRCVEPVDDRSVGAQRSRASVRVDAALGAQVSGHHLRGIERTLREFSEAGVGLVGAVAVVVVVSACPTAEVAIDQIFFL